MPQRHTFATHRLDRSQGVAIVEQNDTPFTASFAVGDRIRLPVAHGEGRYLASDDTLRMLEAEGRVVLRYVPETEGSPWQPNPNGSAAHIAGIRSAAGNVVGIMPHPERADEPVLGLADGRGFFTSMAAWQTRPSTEKASKR